jgi:6-phosphogluconolactonase (cycloisomerase 2 family)
VLCKGNVQNSHRFTYKLKIENAEQPRASRTGHLSEQQMTSKTRALFVVIVTLAALGLAGCGGTHCSSESFTSAGSGAGGGVNAGGNVCGSGAGGGGSNGPSAAFAYYLDSSGVETGALSTSGTFATVSGNTPPSPSGSTIDSMTVVGNYLYLPFGDTTSVVQGLTINHSTGMLTAIPGSPFALTPTGATADSAVADPKGRFLFVGAEFLGSISVFQIDATNGALTQISGSPFTNGFNFFAADIMTVDSTSTYLYAGQGDPSQGVIGFSIDQTSGALTELAGDPFPLNVAQIHASPTGNFLLGVQEIQDANGGATDQHIYVFSIDPTSGVPTPVAGSPFATTSAPFDFAISPNGKFVYVTGNDPVTKAISPIEAYSIDPSSGALTALSGSPYTLLPAATQCQFDPSGGIMFCATSSGISAFSANPSTGALTHLSDLAVSNFPFAVSD